MKYKVTVTPEAAEILRQLYEAGELEAFGIVGVQFEDFRQTPASKDSPPVAEKSSRANIDTDTAHRPKPRDPETEEMARRAIQEAKDQGKRQARTQRPNHKRP